ncbi:MAG: hypothetical protein ACRC8S_07265 [Fimbriiglobus sp.]
MGFTVQYRSTEPIDEVLSEAIQRTASDATKGRTWLGCEPVLLSIDDDGHLLGFSKPNFDPHPNDRAAAKLESLPDGTLLDAVDILCQLSREHGVDWEISHDNSFGRPAGYIRDGICDPKLYDELDAYSGMSEAIDEWRAELEDFEEDED